MASDNTRDLRRFLDNAGEMINNLNIANLLIERCGGMWIYLKYVLEELRDGMRDINSLDALPVDLASGLTKIVDRVIDLDGNAPG